MSSKVRKELRNLLNAIEYYHENEEKYVGKTIVNVLGQRMNAAWNALNDSVVEDTEYLVEGWCEAFKSWDALARFKDIELAKKCVDTPRYPRKRIVEISIEKEVVCEWETEGGAE